jgi:hypothetical protein
MKRERIRLPYNAVDRQQSKPDPAQTAGRGHAAGVEEPLRQACFDPLLTLQKRLCRSRISASVAKCFMRSRTRLRRPTCRKPATCTPGCYGWAAGPWETQNLVVSEMGMLRHLPNISLLKELGGTRQKPYDPTKDDHQNRFSMGSSVRRSSFRAFAARSLLR